VTSVDTDVLIVGAGPGGSAAAYHLARHGIDVTLVEKATFPRTKVCGDGLTPRAVKAMQAMGVETDDPSFEKVIGLRVYSRKITIELPWPELESFPRYGLVMPREGFDQLLAERAVKAGARLLEATEAVAPITEDGWVRGATVRAAADHDAGTRDVRARFTIASDGASSRFAKPLGVRRDDSRPLGIAARRYYKVPYHPGPWFESWLEVEAGRGARGAEVGAQAERRARLCRLAPRVARAHAAPVEHLPGAPVGAPDVENRRVRRQAEHLQEAPVDDGELAARVDEGDARGDVLDEHAELALAGPESTKWRRSLPIACH
jgi:2-polyprenyl-6-methoxyphenol hydroxylase-like FAD-dependent oxidoreductase